MTTRIRWFLAVMALMALVVALWPWRTAIAPTVVVHPAPTVTPTKTQTPPVHAPETPRLLAEAERFELHYALTLDVPDGQARKVGTVALKGTLEQTPLQDPRWVAARLTQATLDLDETGRSLTDFSATPGQDVQTTWLQGVAKDGRVEEVRFQPDVRTGPRGVLAAIAKAVQFAEPPESTAQTWQADETDVNGAYRATYSRQADGSVDKTFQARMGDHLAGAPRQPGYKLTSTAHFHWQDGHLQTVRVTQKGEMHLLGQRTGGHMPGEADRLRYETTVTLQRQGTASADWARQLQPGEFQAFDATAAAGTAQRQVQASYEELLAAAAKAGEAKNVADRAKAANDLADKLEQEPALIAKVEQQLRAGVAQDPVERTLVEALVRADTEGTRQALVGLAADRQVPQPLRERVLQGAVFVPSPDAVFTEGLRKVAFDMTDPAFASMAAMTLGAALSRQEGAAQATGVTAMAQQTQALLAPPAHGEPPATQDVANWVAALGNTGAPEALPPLLQALTDPRERVRVVAALALRFQEPAAVLPAMQKAMLADDSIHVRDNLLQAARFLGPAQLLPLVQKALMEDRNEFVRMGAANTIAAWALDAPALDEVLKQALAQEPSAKVRESLKNYLEPGRVAPPFKLIGNGSKGK
jgi:HEAT repeat protein